ncbi:2OG-Fe(II) oxygenase [Giesbergeria anulus]|uniref:Prolyl 4-hydroxylase n=1 Tax=Giesbergeria anulus TaxID=180197 RepID=A0A1H9I9C1_9BURK|nr:2OG-Fe(II) oxygenase [Giesbergeria anulus]SEQ71157.1 prolyl 4-hydroxylase [Giesbergeria anulus]
MGETIMAQETFATTSASTSATRVVAAPAITPELRAWIISQAQTNIGAPALIQAMTAAGWSEAVAMQALEDTLRGHLSDIGSTGDTTALASPAVPEPALQGEPARLDAGDRHVDVLLSITLPRVVVLGNVLSPEECDALIEAARPRMARSLTVATQTGGEEINADRTSNGMFFQRGESELIARIEARLAKIAHWPVENGEGVQVLHYGPGAEYKPHYDYFDPSQPGTPRILARGGQRVGTFVLYLNTPEQGGGTTFPEIGLNVAAQKGNAVFFSYPQPVPSTRTLHGGAPVLAGEKWIATKWMREREFT